MRVLVRHVDNYHHLQVSSRRAGVNLIEKMKQRSREWVTELVEMEKLTDYTCDPIFDSRWNELMKEKDAFIALVKGREYPVLDVTSFAGVDVTHLWDHDNLVAQAFDMRMRMEAYWSIVLRRLVDSMALHLQLSVHNLVNSELEVEIVSELLGPNGNGIDRLMEESPSVATKRARLVASIKKLKDCKEILSKIMDRIGG